MRPSSNANANLEISTVVCCTVLYRTGRYSNPFMLRTQRNQEVAPHFHREACIEE